MTFTDVVIVYVVLAGVFIAAVILTALWRFAVTVFMEALDGVSREIR